MNMIFEINLRVPFHDLDPLQIVWHGNYLKYFDIARFGLFKQAGVDLYQYFKSRQIIFPVTRSSAKHIIPRTRNIDFRTFLANDPAIVVRTLAKDSATLLVASL